MMSTVSDGQSGNHCGTAPPPTTEAHHGLRVHARAARLRQEVEEFLDDHDDPEVFDVTRENMAQIVDTPKRRRSSWPRSGEQGWLGITWPKEYGGKAGEGIYEYLLNEALAARGGPQIGKGVGIIGKTIISHGSEQAEAGVPAQDPPQRGGVRRRLLRAQRRIGRGLHQLKATKVDGAVEPQGQKTWTTSAHFADWYWVGAAPTRRPSSTTASPVPGADGPSRHHQGNLDDG